MTKFEPIFSCKSRPWYTFLRDIGKSSPNFSGGKKRLYEIQTHFPDASMVDIADDEEVEEAIEFEYALSSFGHHRELNHMEKLADYENLYIVYWDDDRDEEELRKEIRQQGFKGKVEFCCLKRYFRPRLEREPECLEPIGSFALRTRTLRSRTLRMRS